MTKVRLTREELSDVLYKYGVNFEVPSLPDTITLDATLEESYPDMRAPDSDLVYREPTTRRKIEELSIDQLEVTTADNVFLLDAINEMRRAWNAR